MVETLTKTAGKTTNRAPLGRYYANWGLMRMHTDPRSEANLVGHFVDEMARDTSGSSNGLAGRLGTSNCWSELFRRPLLLAWRCCCVTAAVLPDL